MLQDVLERVEAACERAGRSPCEVKLIAVTKGRDVESIRRYLLEHGHTVLGENRIQEWRDKQPRLPGVEWHFIGNLQRNKVKYCLPFSMIHSVNSIRLADELERQGAKHDHLFRVLAEINVSGESSKQGAPESAAPALIGHLRSLAHVEVTGLMTMAPYVEDAEVTRPAFRRLRLLRDRLGLEELSMGMSADFEVAVEEGATMVRVGSAIFNPSPEAVENQS